MERKLHDRTLAKSSDLGYNELYIPLKTQSISTLSGVKNIRTYPRPVTQGF